MASHRFYSHAVPRHDEDAAAAMAAPGALRGTPLAIGWQERASGALRQQGWGREVGHSTGSCVVGRTGIEPVTLGLKVPCSTN